MNQEEIRALKTPEKTEWLRQFLRDGETDADIPDCAYLLCEGEVTEEDKEWARKVIGRYDSSRK